MRPMSFLLGVTPQRFRTSPAACKVERVLSAVEMLWTYSLWNVSHWVYPAICGNKYLLMTSFSLKLDHKHCLHNTTVNVALDLVGTQLVSVECSLYPHLLSTRYLFSLISHFILFFCNNITLSEWTPKIMLSKIVLPTSSPFLLLPCFILRHSVYQLPGIGSVLLFLTFMQLYNVSSMRARTACAIVLYFPCPDWLTC